MLERPEINYAYLSEDSKRLARRALLKAVAIPGFQVPFAGREMPLPYGWGTGGIQVTASLIGPGDVLKVIDQGSDDTTNAVSIRSFFAKTTSCKVTEKTREATIIQTRHRVPEAPLREGQIMVYQVPIPDPLRFLERRLEENRALHAVKEYGILYVKLYEDITRHGEIAQSYDYPAMVNGRYAMSPSPIPRFDNPKLNFSPALHLFGAGREKRVYAVPPYTEVKSLDFSDYPFQLGKNPHSCALCGDGESFLDEVVLDDRGKRIFVCSDTDHCRERREKRAEKESPLEASGKAR
jgi:alpha-D-ribose 1-methylphosphonate 5-phosphate C-P lyase